MQLVMPQLNAWNAKHDFPKLEMGIGVNTGEVVAGNIGSRKRAKYSVVGGNVNLAARIESYTVGGQVLISGATRDAVKAPLTIIGISILEPKGVAQPITIYEVGGWGGNHRLTLPLRNLHRTDLEPPHSLLTFQWVTDKGVSSEKQDGLLVGLSVEEAEIRSQSPPPPFTDLKLLITPTHTEGASSAIYGKVNRRTERSFVLRFTSVPEQVRKFLDCLKRQVARPDRADDARMNQNHALDGSVGDADRV
jgi:adenylate cyclase